ncbi:type II secretion system F family protein [Pleionea sp. CnH1-48]|uniref:type II secretion system F family protein n=1 Tax=Pleionea sp. CnH1-48 TaxID=2954494 RepID=UPI002097DD32|nr:type II secretion system F family protein [Pleionea sp. CnH1-48]MCO7223977.1 type II secretion system F family protein [Pleionea sp. CnH1-48]
MALQTAAKKQSGKQAAAKVSTFAYNGVDKKGKKVSGEIIADSPTIAKAQLRKQGIIPQKIQKKSKSLLGSSKKPIKPVDIAIMSRQLATMMKAGVPLVQSFDIIGKGHENPSMQDLVLAIKADIESGTSMGEALRRNPKYFDDLYCDLVLAGEQSGALENMLDRIATYKEKTEALKSKIKKALFYPVAVVVVAIIVTAILLIFVVPQFQEVFAGFGAELPAFTVMVINLSEFMQEYWWLMLAAIIAFGFAYKTAHQKSEEVRNAQDRTILKLPVVGDILHKAAIARFARTLSTTFAAGVPLVEALDSAAGASGNYIYRTAILNIRDEVTTGTQMHLAMSNTGVFPNMVNQMVAIGEESGSIDAMLGKIADIYEQEVDDAVDGLSSLLEPLIMAVLGVLVGGLIIAMYLPIFQLGAVV